MTYVHTADLHTHMPKALSIMYICLLWRTEKVQDQGNVSLLPIVKILNSQMHASFEYFSDRNSMK